MADKITALLSWCKESGIDIDSRLVIEENEEDGSIAVHNNSDSLIESDTTRKSRLDCIYSSLAWILTPVF